jgi:hypothetical protein
MDFQDAPALNDDLNTHAGPPKPRVKREKDWIPANKLSFFESRLRKFMGELKSLVRDPAPHDPEKQQAEREEISKMEDALSRFFSQAKTSGKTLLLTTQPQNLMIWGETPENRVCLQWEDHGGVILKLQNPAAPDFATLQDIAEKAVLDPNGTLRLRHSFSQ